VSRLLFVLFFRRNLLQGPYEPVDGSSRPLVLVDFPYEGRDLFHRPPQEVVTSIKEETLCSSFRIGVPDCSSFPFWNSRKITNNCLIRSLQLPSFDEHVVIQCRTAEDESQCIQIHRIIRTDPSLIHPIVERAHEVRDGRGRGFFPNTLFNPDLTFRVIVCCELCVSPRHQNLRTDWYDLEQFESQPPRTADAAMGDPLCIALVDADSLLLGIIIQTFQSKAVGHRELVSRLFQKLVRERVRFFGANPVQASGGFLLPHTDGSCEDHFVTSHEGESVALFCDVDCKFHFFCSCHLGKNKNNQH